MTWMPVGVFNEKWGLSVPRYQPVYFSVYLLVSMGGFALLPASLAFLSCVWWQHNRWFLPTHCSLFSAIWFPFPWILLTRDCHSPSLPLPSIPQNLQNALTLITAHTLIFRFLLELTLCPKTKSLTSSLLGKVEDIYRTILKPRGISVWYYLKWMTQYFKGKNQSMYHAASLVFLYTAF